MSESMQPKTGGRPRKYQTSDEWREANAQRMKDYRIKHAAEIKQYQAEYQREYRQKNKDKLNAKSAEAMHRLYYRRKMMTGQLAG